MSWAPITRRELEAELSKQLQSLTDEEFTFFENVRVPFKPAQIDRNGNIETVLIVAKYKDKVVFYDDVEEGFEITKYDGAGVIVEYGSNQYELRHVVNQLRKSNS